MLATVIKFFFLFLLIAGLIIIFQEEIRQMEFFGRLQTTSTPGTKLGASASATSTNTTSVTETIKFNSLPSTPVRGITNIVSSNSTERKVSFGNGKIVDESFKELREIFPGTVVNTITSGVSEYRARGFLEELPKEFEYSEYAGLIAFLDRSNSVKEKSVNSEYFVLLAADNITTPLNITGWQIFDRETRQSYVLPQGSKTFGDGTNAIKDIKLESGNIVIVNSGRSPVGVSFLINKCTGYRSQFKNFSPTVKTECPKPIEELVTDGTVPFTDNICYEFVEDVRACTTITKLPTGVSKSCIAFLQEKLTEEGCVLTHRNEPDFLTNEWRTFLGSATKELWVNSSNILYLVDTKGKLVATLVYE